MRLSIKKWGSLIGGTILSVCAALPAMADDSEIYLGALADSSLVRPNILFVIDTSGSMASTVFSKDPYDPSVTYPNQGCGTGNSRIYYRLGTSTPPSCYSNTWFNTASNKCNASSLPLAAGTGPGTWTGKAAQWNPGGSARRWENLRSSGSAANDPVECETDAGNHGATTGSAAVWARDGDNSNRWTTDNSRRINWASRNVYTLYSQNWLNWYWWPGTSSGLDRLETVQQVVTNVVNSIDNVNIGLMRFDRNANGGMVTHQIANVSTARSTLAAEANSYSPNGNTPLSETFYEAGQYLMGRPVDFGLTSRGNTGALQPSVNASRVAPGYANYKSPIEYQCQKNFVVVLTDGFPTTDSGANAKVPAWPGYSSLVGSNCDTDSTNPSDPEGRCLDDIAEYLYQADLAPTINGKQNAITYTIGLDISEATPFLQEVASRGRGQHFEANDAASLTVALQNIITEILETNVTFTSPTISVNAFNRAQSLDDLYVSVFKPDERLRWRGNLKKYRLDGGVIRDATGANAVNPATGFFADGTQSYWSASPDGAQADQGGASSRLPDPASRKLYTHFAASGSNLTSAGNQLATTNAALTDAVLGTGGAGDPTRDELINWARGQDIGDEDGDSDSTEARRIMGDPIHSRPAVVSYGGSIGSPDANDTVVYVPTNEGYLHAVYSNHPKGQPAQAGDGSELWAFVPEEMLPRLLPLYKNPPSVTKDYGIDGDVRVVKFDRNQDGIVDASAGDRVYLYFGLRRGGLHYYALDVTDRNTPKLLWKKGPAELPGLGFAWSTPSVVRVRISGAAQNAEFFTLVFGGGYDDVQENYDYAVDAAGKRIFMLDAVSGDLVWYAGDTGSGADLELATMENGIPGDITALDTDGDKFADRMYAADMGGRVFRFDVWNGNPRGTLVTGGAIAQLGAAGVAGATIADTRRFYNAPDVALIKRRGAAPYYNIAIGSGYRGHPLHTATRDRFYSIRDKNPFGKLTQAEYAALTPILDADLVNVTDDITTPVPASAPGWKLEMRLHGGWQGEKVLAESVTVNNVILFPSFEPTPPSAASPCSGSTGRNRLYALRVDTGGPAIDWDDDDNIEASERSTDLAQSGIAAELAVLVDHDGDADPDPNDPAAVTPTVCISGVEVLNKCVSIGGTARTFWQRPAQ